MFVNDLQKVIDLNIDSILEYVNIHPESNPIVGVIVTDNIRYGYWNRRYDIEIQAVVDPKNYDKEKPTQYGLLKYYISKMIEEKFGFKCGIDIDLNWDEIEEEQPKKIVNKNYFEFDDHVELLISTIKDGLGKINPDIVSNVKDIKIKDNEPLKKIYLNRPNPKPEYDLIINFTYEFKYFLDETKDGNQLKNEIIEVIFNIINRSDYWSEIMGHLIM